MNLNKKTMINLICSIMVLFVNLIISFVLSPFIVKHIGVEANGFVTLASNFVTYAQLIVAALNSMAARFITLAYVNNDYKKANMYYNSVFWGNLIIVAVLLLPAVIFILKMEKIVDVPSNILTDVKVLFSFVFFNFFVTTGFPNWDCGTFVTNRLDRSYIPSMLTQVLRCAVLFLMLSFLTPHVWYVGFTSSVITLITLAIQGYNTHKLTPELKISFGKSKIICSKYAIKELVGSGIWNSISNVGNMLISGLDLLICNVALGATEMGILSLSKTLPNLMQQLSSSITNSFVAELTIDYAKGDKETVFKNLSRSMKLTSFVLTVPMAGIIILGDRFFELWVPSQDAHLLQVLSILAILGYTFTSGIQILYNVFQVANEVKANAIAMIITGIVSASMTLVIIRFTDFGIYAVAGVSTFVCVIKNMIFTLPFTAKCLGFKWYQFFPQVLTTLISSVILIGVGFVVKHFLPEGSWQMFFVSAIVVGLLGAVVNYFLILNKSDRLFLKNKIKKRLRK